MKTTEAHISTRPAGGDNNDDVVHIVGRIQHWLDMLHVKIPRALCGDLLIGGPDKPEPGPHAPICAACGARNDPSTSPVDVS